MKNHSMGLAFFVAFVAFIGWLLYRNKSQAIPVTAYVGYDGTVNYVPESLTVDGGYQNPVGTIPSNCTGWINVDGTESTICA